MYYSYLHFTDEEIDAQGHLSTLPQVKIVIKGGSIKTKLCLTPQVMLHSYISRTRTQSIIFSPGSDLSKN